MRSFSISTPLGTPPGPNPPGGHARAPEGAEGRGPWRLDLVGHHLAVVPGRVIQCVERNPEEVGGGDGEAGGGESTKGRGCCPQNDTHRSPVIRRGARSP